MRRPLAVASGSVRGSRPSCAKQVRCTPFAAARLLALAAVLPVACGGDANAWFIGGSVTGLTASGLVLATPGQPDLAVAAWTTSFRFADQVARGTAYAVRVVTQPGGGLICAVANGVGVVGGAAAKGIVVGCGSGSGGGRLAFREAPFYPAGDGAVAVALGDLDGDGRADLAVASAYQGEGGGVSVLLNAGGGTFATAVHYPVDRAYPHTLAIGDLNGDGRPDLVVASSGDDRGAAGSVSVLLNLGRGRFAAAGDHDTGSATPLSVAIGDLDGDGRLDLAVAHYGGDTGVLLGRGDGTFAPAIRYGSGAQTAVAIGDLDGDGKADLVVAVEAAGIQVLLNHGDGTFPVAVTYPVTERWVESVAIGDLDGDGRPDLVTAGGSVLLNQGGGTFAGGVAFIAGGQSVAVGDLDGDGKADVAIAGGAVSVLVNRGDATFAPAAGYLPGGSSVALGDLDGDGRADLVVAGGGGVSVLRNDGGGGFVGAANYRLGIAGSSPGPLAIGDLFGDGRAALAVLDGGGGSVGVLASHGDGTFAAAVPWPTGAYYARSLAFGDLDGDGKADLVVAGGSDDRDDPGGVYVLMNQGDGSFAAAVRYAAGTAPWAVALGDFDGDGRADLAVANQGDFGDEPGNVSVLLNRGDGTFAGAVRHAVDRPISLAVGDLDGDGRPDLVVGCYGGVSVLLNRGGGSFAGAADYPTIQTWVISVAVGDLDGDGRPDLAAGLGGCGADCSPPGKTSVLLNRGNGTFAAAVDYVTGEVPSKGLGGDGDAGAVAIGDLDGDGRAELVVANSGTDLRVLVGQGDGTLATALRTAACGWGYSSVALGDLDGDGKPDLAVARSTGVAVLLNRSR